MTNRLIAIIFIFASAVFGQMILGGITEYRTESQDKKLKKAVGQLWGKAQQQNAPLVFRSYKELEEVFEKDNIEPKYVTAIRKELRTDVLVKSDIDATLKLDHRKKGLIWYSNSFTSYFLLVFSVLYILSDFGCHFKNNGISGFSLSKPG